VSEATKHKPCTCVKPTVLQALPDRFEGTIICAKCNGIAKVGGDRKVNYTGVDPVVAFLASRASEPNVETVMVTLLQRIEGHLAKLADGESANKTRK
jgi:hypothetical protein